ncbi:MAG: S8 family serine peptidase [Parcubacteria group bacterium]
MSHRRRILLVLAPLALTALAAPAAGQLLPSVQLPLPNVGGVVRDVQRTLPIDTPDLSAVTNLTDLRRLQVQRLIRDYPREIDVDDHGEAVVRGEVLAVSPSPQSLEIARKLGFEIARQETLDGLDVTLVTLTTPPGMNARQAVKRLRKADPAGQYDYDHIYTEAGAASASMALSADGSGSNSKVRVGLVDTGADAAHPALAGAHVEQRGFAPGGIKPAAHGTATASLIAGRAGAFHGAAPGASLLVADVYGTGPTGGSAAAVVRGLAWMAQERAPVVNVSLVGPPNASLEAVVKALSAQGTLIVAAVGNDGPAAPPLYPASYPQVVSVTGVDARGRVLMEAGHARHVDFAAPASDMAAAAPASRYAAVRGTSFAAPIVAGKLAELMDGRSPAAAQAAVAALARQARDVGPKGRDNTYGRGLVGEDVRVSPKILH